MVLRHRLSLLLVVLALVGCKRGGTTQPDGGAARASDHLADGEVPEGKENAFGLPLPRSAQIAARFTDSIQVVSLHSPEELANFVRARVKDGKVSTATAATRFDAVALTADPKRKLTIEIRRSHALSGFRSEMTVRDVTAPEADSNLSESDRWKKAGLTPDGKLLDPKHMQ